MCSAAADVSRRLLLLSQLRLHSSKHSSRGVLRLCCCCSSTTAAAAADTALLLAASCCSYQQCGGHYRVIKPLAGSARTTSALLLLVLAVLLSSSVVCNCGDSRTRISMASNKKLRAKPATASRPQLGKGSLLGLGFTKQSAITTPHAPTSG